MALKGKDLGVFVGCSLIWCVGVVLLSVGSSFANPSDIYCLKEIKASLEDPYGYLSSWDFNNNTEGNFCTFAGVNCWKNRVLGIRLGALGLSGPFPRGIENCTSLTGLEFSNNNFSGVIPPNISDILKYVTYLDLSYNRFDGEIPASFVNCIDLNVLNLANNLLTGGIPAGIGLLNRLRTLNVANNQLTGPVPTFASSSISITADSYANNTNLCGGPLKPCPGTLKKSRIRIFCTGNM